MSGSFGATWVPTPRPLLDSAYDLPVDQLTFCIFQLGIAWPFSGVEDPGGLQLQWFRAAEGMVLPQLGHVGAFLDLLSP